MNEPAPAEALLAVGLCRAGRLLGGASLLLSSLAFGMLTLGHPGFSSRFAWLTIALLGLPGLYLSLRLSIDEPIFAHLADRRVSTVDFLNEFDAARQNLGLGAGQQPPRPLVERVRGVGRLFKTLLSLLILQWLLTLTTSGFG
ncbi:MAG: hypothetical protein JNL84_09430 [Candidatus Accumulibacter sp.]|nr:hypothetical protein [Accumulibacter sp.]